MLKKKEPKEKKVKEEKIKEKKIKTKNVKEKKVKENVPADEQVKTKKFSFGLLVLAILLILVVAFSGYLSYQLLLLDGIENLVRYIVIAILGLIDFIFLIRLFVIAKTRKKKRKKHILFGLFMFLFAAICFAGGFVINYLYSKVDNINKDLVTYSSSLLVMSDDKATKIEDIVDYEIGILTDEKSPEGYIIPQEIVKEYTLHDTNFIKSYENYSEMLVDMYAGELDALFITSNYVDMYSDITGYEDIATDTKVIISKEKEMKKSETSDIEIASANKSVTEPFTILLMGIDSTAEVLSKNAVANGDTLILITFNPKTLNATMLSIPRDSYVPIACWANKAENKITHAAGYGNDCMINTIQNYFGITIDYYAKINFKGLVKLVNAVGGVEVDVPSRLCTDDSSRYGTVCIEAGRQVLNGEQALVFARNRKQLANGDFGRAQHQQEIIMALINKMKTITKVSQFTTILDTVSNSLDTNLTTKQILEFYNVGKDIIKKSSNAEESNLINIQQLYLSGNSQMIYDEGMRMVLYNYVPNKSSKADIVQAMKENLELTGHNDIKTFSFSINVNYEKNVIGKGPYRTGSGLYQLLPSFIGMSASAAEAKAKSLGLSVIFAGEEGTVIEQNYPANKRMDKIGGPLYLTLSGPAKTEKPKDEDKDDKESTEDKEDSGDKDNNSGSGDSSTPSTPTTPTTPTTPNDDNEDAS